MAQNITTAELSDKLCKICNIEVPGRLKFFKRGWNGKSYIMSGHGYKQFDFTSQPYVDVRILPTCEYNDEMGFVFPYTEIENIKKIYDENGYDFIEFKTASIDFEKLTNFTKLLEIITKHSSISFCHNGNYYGCEVHYFIRHIFEAIEGSIAKVFLNALLSSEAKNGCKPTLLEKCAKELRSCKWDYSEV